MVDGNFREFEDGASDPPPEDVLRLFPITTKKEEPESGLSLPDYKAAFDSIANVVCTDPRGIIIYANENFLSLNKCSLEDVLGKYNKIFNLGYHPREFFRDLWKTIKAGKTWTGEICNCALDGTLYWVDTQIAPRYDETGRKVGYVALRVDITARKQAEARAQAENSKREETEALLNDIVETLPNGVIAYDGEGRIRFFNDTHRALYEELGQGVEIGRRRQDIVELAGRREVMFDRLMAQGDGEWPAPGETYVLNLPNDRWIQVQSRRSATGTLVSVQTDVTDLKHAEQRIAHQAAHDYLTGACITAAPSWNACPRP